MTWTESLHHILPTIAYIIGHNLHSWSNKISRQGFSGGEKMKTLLAGVVLLSLMAVVCCQIPCVDNQVNSRADEIRRACDGSLNFPVSPPPPPSYWETTMKVGYIMQSDTVCSRRACREIRTELFQACGFDVVIISELWSHCPITCWYWYTLLQDAMTMAVSNSMLLLLLFWLLHCSPSFSEKKKGTYSNQTLVP